MNTSDNKVHKTVYVESLGDDIDEQIVDLVLQFNGSGVETVSSCQGDPGIIGEGGRYGHVCFVTSPSLKCGYSVMATLLFELLFPIFKDMWDDVRIEMSASSDQFLGWVYFRNETIKDILLRMRDSGISK